MSVLTLFANHRLFSIILFALMLTWTGVLQADSPKTPLQFNRDIRPILAENCYECHGPDEAHRKAELRLDRETGNKAIPAGEADTSELVRRISLPVDDPDHMPHARSGKVLTDQQVATLRNWIEQGAVFEEHWAFVPPRRSPLPITTRSEWTRNAIDRFVLAKLEEKGFNPNEEADRRTLIRRVTFDLTGLPPTLEDVRAFVSDNKHGAYERLVDRLLNSPRFGEHRGRYWLDAARYADTDGYQDDMERTQWPWRDWVVQAINANMPFDQFTIEQLAGDLLPNATASQVIATAFNRNHMIMIETGIIDEEYRVEYVVDRVVTTSTVWLGLTMGCARCHDHKYDPITQKDFYSLFAYFNTIPERGLSGFDPRVSAPTDEQAARLETLDANITRLTKAVEYQQKIVNDLEKQIADERAAGEPDRTSLSLLQEAQVKLGNAHEIQRARLKELVEQTKALNEQIVKLMIMKEMPDPRSTHILHRGQYDQLGEQVTAATPVALGSDDESQSPQNRLTLARWLLSPEHPLTARVTVNRIWHTLLGRGLVETTEDFGTQGAMPSHPQLLDWLALEFIQQGWDVKRLIRMIVTSSTYRQSSHMNDSYRMHDPNNTWLWRGPRHRHDAEVIRDQALAVGGLLVEQIGGPSVYPYQPLGVWTDLFNREKLSRPYPIITGDGLYRRSVYSFWKRTVPPPAMTAFDSPDREYCIAKRSRTNTPLQALVLLHDPQFVEAARVLAGRVLREAEDRERLIGFAFELATSRPPTDMESVTLYRLLRDQRKAFEADPQAAERLLAVGDAWRDPAVDPTEHAAWTMVMRLLLNLDEVIVKN